MILKRLKEKVEVFVREYPRNLGLEYYLLESEDKEDYYCIEDCAGYGIEIVKIFKNKPVEKISFTNVTPNKEDAMDIIDILARNTVTPMELPYILDDLVGV
jgi:hypothetical protein